jgi:hypothetical protein
MGGSSSLPSRFARELQGLDPVLQSETESIIAPVWMPDQVRHDAYSSIAQSSITFREIPFDIEN